MVEVMFFFLIALLDCSRVLCVLSVSVHIMPLSLHSNLFVKEPIVFNVNGF